MEKKLTIVYHLYQSHDRTREYIVSLLSQSDKNFNIICILDNIDDEIKSILNDKEIVQLILANTVSCMVVDKTLGHSWCFNQAYNMIQTPYVYFCANTQATSIFDANFVKEINEKLATCDPDLILFNFSEETLEHFMNLTQKQDEFHYYLTFFQSYLNKVLKMEFLKKHNIKFCEFKNYTHYIVYDIVSHYPFIEQIPKILITMYFNKHPGYNIYDVLTQFKKIYSECKDSPFFIQFKDSIEYMFIRTTLFTFIHYMYINLYKTNKKAFELSIEKAIEYIDRYAPNWKQNKYLNSKETLDRPAIREYLQHFDGDIRMIAEEMEKLEKENAW